MLLSIIILCSSILPGPLAVAVPHSINVRLVQNHFVDMCRNINFQRNIHPWKSGFPKFCVILELDVKVINIRRMERMQFPTRDEDFKRRLMKGYFA